MKKIFTILLMLITLSVNAQWVQQTSNFNNALLAVKFINRTTGFCSGRDGQILKTTNSGINWITVLSSLSGKSMYGLSVVNENVVYSVGHFETIVKTTNGGNNWNIIKNGPYGTGHSYEGVYFLNENTGWICGSGSLIFKTTNGGVSFDSVNIPVGYLFDIYFRNANEGLVCGEAATMYKTTNGGLNWQEIIVPVGTEAADFFKLSVINNNIIYTQGVQNNKIYKSIDFGISWDSIARVQGADDSYSMYFPNEMTGWCAGTYGYIFKTTNGGYNWYQENTSLFNNAFIREIWCYNDSVCWAVGGLGKILYTTNGGSTYIENNYNKIKGFTLFQNYPNPFNSNTILQFEVRKKDNYTIRIFDVLGRLIQEFYYNNLLPGNYKISFDGTKLSSGIYYYRLSSSNNYLTKSMVLIK